MNHRTRSLTSGVVLLLAISLVHADWIPFTNNPQFEPEMTSLYSNTQGYAFRVSVYGCDVQTIDTDDMINTTGEAFTLLSLLDGYHIGDIGKPNVPMISRTIAVPIGAEVTFTILQSEYEDFSLEGLGINTRLMPALESVLKIAGEKPVFVLDDKTYNQNAYYPQSLVSIMNDDIMRGHRLVTVQLTPIQYNPVTNTIRCYTSFDIRVDFIGGDQTATSRRVLEDYSPVFEEFIKARVSNYELYETYTRDVLPLPIHYLIITHNNFQTQVNDLAAWFKKKGFKVKVANQDSISSWTTSGIAAYIDAQSPAPTYLLLVGDVNGGYMPAPYGGSSGKVTDLYYAELDGSGYLPDMFYGRLSVENTTHITAVVDKILTYEQADMPSGWYKDDAFCAGNDNYTTSEGTHDYCTSTFMDPNGYTTYKLYEVTYGATTADVTNNVNAGRTLITMSGHGSDDGWHDGPQFVVSHINALTNGDRLTIATGHCCLANNFGSSTNPCGGEAWQRKANGGAVGYYGSCPSTYWGEDDWLQREWYEGIYADHMYEHGRFTLDGMYDGVYMSGSNRKQYYYEGYHILGDPSLDLWTDEPGTMTVTHNPVVFPDTTDYTVLVFDGGTPLEDALVCCWIPGQSPEVHEAVYTNSAGAATLTVIPETVGDTMYVTVTKHDYAPYLGHALVTAETGPYVVAGATILNDGGNGQANPGESIDFGVYAKNIGVDAAYGVYGLLSETDPYITVTNDSGYYGTIPAGDSVLSNPYYEFDIATNCPNNYEITFDLEFCDNLDSTWMSHLSITVYAPVLTYQEHEVIGGNGNGILDPDETVDLVITLENEGGATAENVTSTIVNVSSTYVTVNDASGTFGTIAPGATADNSGDPYNVTADASTPTGTSVQFDIEVVSGTYIDTVSFSLVIGKKHYYIWNPDPTPAPGQNMHSILGTLGYSGDYSETSLAADLTMYQSVLVCVGIYSSNYEIAASSPQALALEDYLQNQDGRMYLEGGDVWYYDPIYGGYDFCSLFGINAVDDGDDDLGPVVGESNAFTTGMSFAYGGENSWIDHINPAGSGFLIFHDGNDNYNCGVANDAGIYRTVGTSFELGLLTDASGVSTRAVLIDSIMKFFGIIAPGVEEQPAQLSMPLRTMMTQVFPNPIARNAFIRYQLAQQARVNLQVFDAAGRVVRNLEKGMKQPGYYTVTWDGKDNIGRFSAAGVYFIRFQTDDCTMIQKAVVVR
jgi:hypothetical protein